MERCVLGTFLTHSQKGGSMFGTALPGNQTKTLALLGKSEENVAAMKIAAIMDRGTKKDFVDLYTIIKQVRSIEEVLALYKKKYGTLEDNIFSIIKSLQYFDDAENSLMPKMISSVSWDEVKDFFAKESIRLAKKYI